MIKKILFLFTVCIAIYWIYYSEPKEEILPIKISKKSQIQKKDNPKNQKLNQITKKETKHYMAIGEEVSFNFYLENPKELTGEFQVELHNMNFNIGVVNGFGFVEDNNKIAKVSMQRHSPTVIIANINIGGVDGSASPQGTFPVWLNDADSPDFVSYDDPNFYAQSQYELEIKDQQYQEQSALAQYEQELIHQEEMARVTAQEQLDYNQEVLDPEIPWSAGAFNFNFEDTPYYGQEISDPEAYHN